ncbi:MAG: UTP--glucose-1-phosphate uridylyltransferase [Planctomycetota bacterium]
MNEDELRERLRSAGQEQVLAGLGGLDAERRAAFLAQLAAVDLALLERLTRKIGERREPPPPAEPLEPVVGDPAQRAAWADRGWEALRAGRVALLVVAGGQGSRLGWEAPKGTYPVGPLSQKSLFELFAEQVRALGARAGRPLPWYVLTSRLNRAETEAYFAERGWLGLAPEQVRFLVQRDLPSTDLEGRMLLAEPGVLATNPDGHGGALLALEAGGALERMRVEGQDLLFYWQIDNPLCPVADPVFLGAHLEHEAQVSSKVVKKTDPLEKVGVLGLRGGKTAVVEYSEVTPEQRDARTAEGELCFRAGNIAIHLFGREFLAGLFQGGELALDYHLARKAAPVLDADGVSREREVVKFETFIFDVLPRAERHLALLVERVEEFEPLKNRDGDYSPETVRAALSARAARWLAEAGHTPPLGATCEVSPLAALSPADLRGKRLPALEAGGVHVQG